MTRSLGEFEILVLFAILALDADAYGAEIVRFLTNRTNRSVAVGAVGSALSRLEARGLVTSRLGEPTPERGGKRKRHYNLTRTGAAELRESYNRLRTIARGQVRKLEDLV